MDYGSSVQSGDPFAVARAPSGSACRDCGSRVEITDGFCRTCGASDPAERENRGTARSAERPARGARATGNPVGLRVSGGLLVLAALLVGVGCRLPWISAWGLLGLAPPMEEIWPITVGAGLVGVLGLGAMAYGEGASRITWLLSLLVVAGMAVLTYPHYRGVTQEVTASGGEWGVSQGVGLWLVAVGIVTGLVASGAGWRAGARSGSR